MAFNSLLFIFFFLPIFLLLFYVVPKKCKIYVLLLFSIIFYYFSGLFNLIILLAVTLFNYLYSFVINKYRNKFVLIINLLINLVVLGLFKYNTSLVLPLGISFYTFNNISYIVDLYNKKCSIIKNIFYYFTSSMLFTHVTMGPISKYSDLYENLKDFDYKDEDIYSGFRRFLSGLIKKVLVADNLGLLVSNLGAISDKSSLVCLLYLVSFALQLYIDFASYSDMAIGLGKMIGLKYKENFDYPYIAKSITDYWRRWHISLSTFFRDYVYIPLGGNRVGVFRHIINLLIVWCLTGIWHGRTINFMLWGLYYGIILIIEKYVLKDKLSKLPNFLQHIYTIVIFLFGYIFFSISDFNEMGHFIRSLFTNHYLDSNFVFYLKENILLLVVGIILCFKLPDKIKKLLDNKYVSILSVICYIGLFILVISYILGGSFSPFLYTNF